MLEPQLQQSSLLLHCYLVWQNYTEKIGYTGQMKLIRNYNVFLN